jgi:ACR3 family arsenite efflux pump ArsB
LQSAFFKISIAFTNSKKLEIDFEKTETSNPTKEKKASAIKIAIAASMSIRPKKEALPLRSQKSLTKRYKYLESN